ncbi:hypothetical protein AK830_g5629, partial [Neonectria ditissima]
MRRSTSSSSSETVNEKPPIPPPTTTDGEKSDPRPYSMQRIPSQNNETDANIYPEPANAVQADLERGGLATPEPAKPGAAPAAP